MKHEMDKLGHELQVKKLDQKHAETLQVCIFINGCFWESRYCLIKEMKLGFEGKNEEKKEKEENEEKEKKENKEKEKDRDG